MPFRLGHEDLDAVIKAEQPFRAVSVAQQRIEGAEDTDAGGGFRYIRQVGGEIGKGKRRAGGVSVAGEKRNLAEFIAMALDPVPRLLRGDEIENCLLYTSDAADE